MSTTGSVFLFCSAAAALCCGCERSTATDARAETGLARQPASDVQVGYPEGPWWDNAEELNGLLLSGAHILVSHREAKPGEYLVPTEPVGRSKQEALRKAATLSAQLRAHPEQFASVARRESDEPATRAMGGALGVFYAPALPLEIIDAFGHLRIDEVSKVVETEQGYHVLRRLAVPTASDLSYSQIVIKFDGAIGWRRTDRVVQDRSRSEARALAERVAVQAQQRSQEFARFVQLYSESDDVDRAGDVGVWSRHEDPGRAFVLHEAASRLRVGQVSDPVEALSGFHIIMRTPADERPLIAASSIFIFYDGMQLEQTPLGSGRSKRAAEQLAKRLIRDLRKHPERFERTRERYCEMPTQYCQGPSVWHVGRELVAFERAALAVPVGGVAEPIDTPLGYLLVRREDTAGRSLPEPRKPRVVRFEYPLAEALLNPGTAPQK